MRDTPAQLFHFLDVFLWCPSNLERLRWILPLPSSLTGIVLLCRLFMDWSFFISILYLVLVGTSLVTSSSACSSEAPCLETTSLPPQLSPVCGCFSCYTLSETFFALSIYRYCIYICVHVYFTSLPRDLYSFLVFSSLTFSHPHSHAGGCVNGLERCGFQMTYYSYVQQRKPCRWCTEHFLLLIGFSLKTDFDFLEKNLWTSVPDNWRVQDILFGEIEKVIVKI